MPYIKIESFEGRSIEQKRKLAEGITKLMVEIFKAKQEGVRIVFEDVKKHNYAHGGLLWTDIEGIK